MNQFRESLVFGGGDRKECLKKPVEKKNQKTNGGEKRYLGGNGRAIKPGESKKLRKRENRLHEEPQKKKENQRKGEGREVGGRQAMGKSCGKIFTGKNFSWSLAAKEWEKNLGKNPRPDRQGIPQRIKR